LIANSLSLAAKTPVPDTIKFAPAIVQI